MQHSEEVGAGEELCAGGLEQQGEARPRTGLSHAVVPTQLYNTHIHRVRVSALIKAQEMLYRLHRPEYTAVRGLPGMEGCMSVSSGGSSLVGCSSGLLSLVIVLRIL